MFVVVEGSHGVGKSTVAAGVGERLGATVFHFPDAFMRLRAEVGLDDGFPQPARLAYYAAGVLHLSDMVAAQLPVGNVVCDRYLASVMSIVMANATSTVDEAELAELFHPFERFLVRPVVTFLVTADHEAVVRRLTSRAERGVPLDSAQRHALESRSLHERLQALLRANAARLGRTVELDTTDLDADQATDEAARLLAPFVSI